MNFGSNNFIWILFLLLLMPNGFGGGCGDNSFIFLILILLLMQNGSFGICEAK